MDFQILVFSILLSVYTDLQCAFSLAQSSRISLFPTLHFFSTSETSIEEKDKKHKADPKKVRVIIPGLPRFWHGLSNDGIVD